MKFYLLLLLPLIIVSCQKSGVSDNPPVNTGSGSSLLSSVRTLSYRTQLVDSFRYDSTHKLAEWIQYVYDTTSGTPAADSQFYSFAFAANATVPHSYMISHRSTSDMHQLTYDAQNRLVKDTGVSGSGFVAYFSYPSGNMATTVLFDGTIANNQVDTLFLTNGNITEERIYFPNNAGTADSLVADLQVGHAASANPGYQPAIANTVGPLLFILAVDGFGGYSDFISNTVVNKLTGIVDGLPAGGILNYTIKTDASGRVIESSVNTAQGYSNIVFTYY